MFLYYFIQLLKEFHYGFKRTMIGLFIMSVVGGFLELLGIAMIFPVMLILTSSSSSSGQAILNLCHKFMPNMPELKIAFILSLLMISVFIFKNIFMMLYIHSQNKFTKNWSNYVTSIVIKKLLYAPYKDTMKIPYGDKEALLSSSIRAISLEFMLRCIILFANFIVALFIIGLLFYKFTLGAFLSVSFILIFVFFENLFFKNKARKLGDIGLKLENNLYHNTNFIIKSQKEIITANKQKFFAWHLINSSEKLSENFAKRISYGNFPLYVTEIGVIFSFLIMVMTITFGSGSSKEIIISSLAAITLIVLRLVPQLNKIIGSIYAISASEQKVKWFLENYKIIAEYKEENIETQDKIPFDNELKLENVGLNYENKKGVRNINLTVKKGEFIGIIGASGSGKTTLANILSGIFSADEGNFYVDNTKITKENLFSLRNLVSFLPQEGTLFDGSVLENIAWGETDVDKERAKAALLFAGGEIDINSKTELSCGQKQRVCLARAYYKNFEILILDEATSSLDINLENTIISNILKLKGKKTIISIAHRLSTLKECDMVIYLEEGTIKDKGTLEELINRNEELNKVLNQTSFD